MYFPLTRAKLPSPISARTERRCCNSLPSIYFVSDTFRGCHAHLHSLWFSSSRAQGYSASPSPPAASQQKVQSLLLLIAQPPSSAAFSAKGAVVRTVECIFSDSSGNVVIPTRIPKLIQMFGVANESCVTLYSAIANHEKIPAIPR